MRSPNQNVKSSNRVHSYILRLQIGQYVEQQTDSISKLVSVSSKLQLTTTSSTLQLSTNQLYSHFSGTTELRPRQTVPIPCLFPDSHGMLEPRPRQTVPIQSVSRFYSFKNWFLSLCTSAIQLMCEPCNVLQPGPQLSIQIKSQIPSSKFPLAFHSKPSTNAN